MVADARLTDEQFRRAGALLGARSGLRFDAANRALLEEGLIRAAAAVDTTVEALLTDLAGAPSEALLQSVLRQVTIGETYFFRHPEHFAALREHILPERLRARGPAEPLRVWSAGCATGEEAWSLLLAIHEAGRRATVLGTDINETALERARSGRYAGWSIRGELPCAAGLLRRHADEVEVAPWLHAHARFDCLNLTDAIYPSLYTGTVALDVIFCRNVIVYFAAQTAKWVLARLADALADGAWLVVSALDLPLAPPGLERVAADGATLLRKPLAARAPSTLLALPTPRRRRQAHLVASARDAAARGALGDAIELLRAAVATARTAEALHLLALLVGQRGDDDERLTLLAEVAARAPDDALAHLSLGLDPRRSDDERAQHLRRVLQLTEGRRNERLTSPEPLPIDWVHKMAKATLRRLERAQHRGRSSAT
jgi:chemotaxis protein methyltransferase CheR